MELTEIRGRDIEVACEHLEQHGGTATARRSFTTNMRRQRSAESALLRPACAATDADQQDPRIDVGCSSLPPLRLGPPSKSAN